MRNLVSDVIRKVGLFDIDKCFSLLEKIIPTVSVLYGKDIIVEIADIYSEEFNEWGVM